MLRSGIQRSHVPDKTGVYQFKSPGDRLLYIGKAKNIKKRLQQYFTPSSVWKQDMVAKAGYVEWFPTDTEQEALILETQMINHHTPPYNNLIKGNSSYIYIKIDNHEFPRIGTTRYKKNDDATYIGPKTRHRDIKNFLRIARHLFQRRSCSVAQFNRGKVCSDYYFGQCGGWCAYKKDTKKGDKKGGFKANMDYNEAKSSSEEMVKMMRTLFSGRIGKFQKYIEKKITLAAEKEHFERAAKLKEIYEFSERLKEKQTVIVDSALSGIYCYLQDHGKYHLRVVVTLNEGRIIDIIGQHEHKIDIDKDSLVKQIEREYDIELQQNKHQENSRYALGRKRISKKILKKIQENAERFITGYTHSRFAAKDPGKRMKQLKKLEAHYDLPKLPERMECLDISHFSGEHIVGGLSAMHNGILAKNNYRKYKLKTIDDNDDYASIREILERKFHKKNKKNFPDLFVIDGGERQLGVVKKLLEEDKDFAKRTKMVTFASIGKGHARTRQAKVGGESERFHVLKEDGSIKTEPITYNDADKLLILLRDEAHRFANKYRKKLISKEFGG